QGGDADAEEQLQAGPQGDDAAHVERAALPAAGVRLEAEVDPREVPALDHAVPADADRVEPFDQLPADPEDGGPFGAEQPLVAVRRQEVDRRPLNVEREDAQALDGVHEEGHAALPAELAECVQVVAEATGELDEAKAEYAGAAVHGGADVVQRD